MPSVVPATASVTAPRGLRMHGHQSTVVGTATRIWELNVHWPLYSQCGIWDPRGRGVDVWECVQDHSSTPGTQPPNANYWRYVTRR